jgi:hypothetical protein
MYALAASAAGVGALCFAKPAEPKFAKHSLTELVSVRPATMLSVDVLKPVFRRRRKVLSSASLKLRQFSLQPSKLQKTSCYFTEITPYKFATVPAACAMVNICEHVLNDLLPGTQELSYFAILQAACDEKHRLELHRFQEIG